MIQLIEITEAHFPQWQQYRKAVYPVMDEHYDKQEMQRIFRNKDWQCRFITQNDTIIGLVELSIRNIVDGCLSSPVAYLEGFYLDAAYRGKGTGKKVMQIIMELCRQQGFSELATDTELTNTQAQNFYTKIGFEETDRVVEYRISLAR